MEWPILIGFKLSMFLINPEFVAKGEIPAALEGGEGCLSVPEGWAHTDGLVHRQFKIIINDDGKGFAKEILDQIGNPYISKNNYGMGLGIFIAKNLIENIEGSIFCKNQKDGGASVEIIIIRGTATWWIKNY